MADEDVTPNDDSSLMPAERWSRIMDWFATNQVGSCPELARRLNISISTIRRDLDHLASQGLVKRTHGGAVRIRRNTTFEQQADEASVTALTEKRAIAQVAADLLQPGQSLFIDSRSTLHELASVLAERSLPLTVVTNDLHVADRLALSAHIQLVVPGGIRRTGAYTLLGDSAIAFVRSIHCDHFFLSAQAVDNEWISDTALELVQLQQAMIDNATQTSLLIDSSRFDGRATYRTAPLERVARIMTDEGLSSQERCRYAAIVPELIIAPYPQEA